MKHFKQFSIGFVCFIGLAVAALWIVLSSPMMRDYRVAKSAEFLTKALGQPVVIDGDIYVSLSPKLAVVAHDFRLPSADFDDVDLATLSSVRFPLPVGVRLTQGLLLPEIEARGLLVNVIAAEDGRTTWVKRKTETASRDEDKPKPGQRDIIAFLGDRDIAFSDMRVRVLNRVSGFEYDFELERFTVVQDDTGNVPVANVTSRGGLNGQPFSLNGRFPTGERFNADGQVGALDFEMVGIKPAGAAHGDFDAELSLTSDDTQALLELLRLEGSLAATADATVSLVRRNTLWDLENIDLNAQLENGQVARLEGRFSDARRGANFDLTFNLDFVGTNAPLPPAVKLKDIRPQELELQVSAEDGIIEIDSLQLSTNAFDEGFRDIGPFRIGRIQRSEDGQLQLDNASFYLGPADYPVLEARARVENLLTFSGYVVEGTLDLPAERIFVTLPPDAARAFGRLTGQLVLQETDGKPDLATFQLGADDSDLWTAEMGFKAPDLQDMSTAELSAKIEAPDGGRFLEALQLEPVDIGPIGSDLQIMREDGEVVLDALTFGGETELHIDLSLRILSARPVVRGGVHSDELRIEDVRNKISMFRQLMNMRKAAREIRAAAQGPEEEAHRFVRITTDVAPATEEDLSDFQPLVLPKTEAAAQENDTLSEFEALVVGEDVGDIPIADLIDVNVANVGRMLDAALAIDIARIVGQDGISALQSDLIVQDGTGQLGPVQMTYGSGDIDFSASMDFVDAPERLRVTGRTGGWDLGEILDEIGMNPGAYGTLNGQFDLQGQRFSVRDFLTSMQGSATLDLSNGRLSTALIELAGLGVLPWLFSTERRQGYADIVCLKAPMTLQNGRIDLGESVLETPRVQLVGTGAIDLRGETISVTAEPRPVGQPLARSAWPVEVSGSLTSPKIAVAERKTRRARVPLSMPETRTPCVPDVSQLQTKGTGAAAQ